MKRQGILILGVAVLLAACLQAQVSVPSPLPAFNLSVSPTNPTSASTVNLNVSTVWPNNCVPVGSSVVASNGNIEVELRLPDTIDCNAPEPVCQATPVAFNTSAGVGPLAPGLYTVSVRIVSCDASSTTGSIGSFTVGLPAGGLPAGGNGAPVTLAPGTTVVLLQNNGSVRAGQAGLVVCCDAEDCSGRVLVSWFLHTQGSGTTGACVDNTPRIIPPASATWVDPSVVPLGVAFNQCGTLRQNSEGCFVLEGDDGRTYLLAAGSWLPKFLGPTANFDLGDRIRVQGLVSVQRPGGIFFACTEQDGDVYHPVITPCTPAGGNNGNGNGAGCCPQNFRPGDRVRLLINNPPDLTGARISELLTGALGTVVCCDTGDENFKVFVSWDGLTTGNNMHFFCDAAPTITYPDSSGWWMRCADLALLAGGGDDTGGGAGPLCPNDNLSVSFGSTGVRLIRDPRCPATPRDFSGCTTVTIQANFRARLTLRVTPQPGITGTWTGTITPDIVPAGQTSVQVCVNATDVGLSNIPVGQATMVATVAVQAVPAP